MSWIIDILWLLSAVVAQGAWEPVLSIWGVMPYLPLIPVTRIALSKGEIAGNLTGFGAGLLMDIFSLDRFGLRALQGAVLGFLLGASRDRVEADSFQIRVLFVAVAVLLHHLVVTIVVGPVTFGALAKGLGSGIYTGALAAVVWTIRDLYRSRFNRSHY